MTPMALTSFQTTTQAEAVSHLRQLLVEIEAAGKKVEEADFYHEFLKDWLSSAVKLKPDAWEEIYPPDLWPADHCGCGMCTVAKEETMSLEDGMLSRRMITCPNCGNKRCPHALNHEMRCTHSNDPGQIGTPRLLKNTDQKLQGK